MRAAAPTPRSARISTSSSSSSTPASSLRLETRSVIAVAIEAEVRARPPRSRRHQLCRASPVSTAASFGDAVIHVGRRDTRFAMSLKEFPPEEMTPDEMLARVLHRDGLMLVIDKPAGMPVHRGPKGGGEPRRPFRRPALRPAAAAGARPPPRQGHLGMPGAGTAPQGACSSGASVQARQGRQDLLGAWSKAAPRTRTAPSTCRWAGSTRAGAGG